MQQLRAGQFVRQPRLEEPSKHRAGLLDDFSFHPTQSAAQQDDGSLLISFRAAGVEEICSAIFGCGAPVRVLGPDTLAVAYKVRLQAALAACSYQQLGD